MKRFRQKWNQPGKQIEITQRAGHGRKDDGKGNGSQQGGERQGGGAHRDFVYTETHSGQNENPQQPGSNADAPTGPYRAGTGQLSPHMVLVEYPTEKCGAQTRTSRMPFGQVVSFEAVQGDWFRLVSRLRHPPHSAGKIAFLAAIFALGGFARADETRVWPSVKQYPGITARQSALAHSAMRAFYNGDRLRARAALEDLESLESNEDLPPLSQLLLVAVNVIHLQRDDAESEAEEKSLREEIRTAAEQGFSQCSVGERKTHPTCLLIEGGLRGFLATLKISGNPVGALRDALQALKLLEKALAGDGRLKDAYMGSGIFHCSVARAPFMVRASLSMLGRPANYSHGLSDLRASAYHGQYTAVASQFYLIQFLSPYNDEFRREKSAIFRNLEKKFPESLYATFLRWEETLCFQPDSFSRTENLQELESRMSEAVPRDFAGRRYLALVKHQYSILPNANPAMILDSLDLREYAYYPVFLRAMQTHIRLGNLSDTDSNYGPLLKELKIKRDSALSMLENSGMSPANLGLFSWHVKDALKTERRKPAPEMIRDSVETQPDLKPDSLSK